MKVAERLLWHTPDNHALNRELAGLYLRRNDPRRALQKLQACFKADPRDVETLGLLAQAFQALDQKPKTVSVLKELARIHVENGDSARARRHVAEDLAAGAGRSRRGGGAVEPGARAAAVAAVDRRGARRRRRRSRGAARDRASRTTRRADVRWR